jgi:8-oxo-dGTP pyrophosphatase MutT (NUDIX family)
VLLVEISVPAPAWLAEHARRFAESGASAATPRNAATVILLRSASPGLVEVYAVRRAATMSFAPGMYAFPGGSVDPRDSAHRYDRQGGVAWHGPSPTEWAARLGQSEPDAVAVICAAIRELFEETGVLLAGPDAETVLGDVSGTRWETDRRDLETRARSLTEVLGDAGLAVRSDLLYPWARWLTPEFEPKRFDTYFFLAQLPAEQLTREVGGEADHVTWVRPAAAAEWPMLPPTRHEISRLAQFSDVDSALAAAAEQDLTAPLRPRIEDGPDGARLVMIYPTSEK